MRRLRYWFDNTMSRGTIALIGWLAAVSVTAVVGVSSLVVVLDDKPTTLDRAFGEIWRNTVDTFNLGAGEGSPVLVALTILLAMAGIFFASTLVGLITSGVNKKIMDLRKGRSLVLERDHTVIIGWSDQVFTLVSELILANQSRSRAVIAILADKDRTEMEDVLRDRLGTTGNTRVICRTGNPIDARDIELVNPREARSVIVLSPPGAHPDRRVIKTLLAIGNDLGRAHVVASVTDGPNHAAAILAGGAGTLVINADDLTARLIVQTCRQPGLSVVYTDLLDFAGDELYITGVQALVGCGFGAAMHAFRTSTLIGLQRPDGSVVLKPSMDTALSGEDLLVVIAADDSAISASSGAPVVSTDVLAVAGSTASGAERALMLGWNRRAATIVRELDAYVPPGSALDIVARGDGPREAIARCAGKIGNLTIGFTEGDTSDRDLLDSLGIARYDRVIVLSQEDVDRQQADAHTLVTLLHLRDMQTRSGDRYTIVSEMGDDRNRRLAQITRADDFIVSEKLISLLMAQLSENRHLAAVFADLFDPSGAEIYLKPASDYVSIGRPLDFHAVVEAGRRRQEVALGYRLAADSDRAPGYGVVLNPDKAAVMTFGADDKIIVLASG